MINEQWNKRIEVVFALGAYAFKTVAAVKAASISDLEEVKGISHAKAEMLYNALRNGV